MNFRITFILLLSIKISLVRSIDVSFYVYPTSTNTSVVCGSENSVTSACPTIQAAITSFITQYNDTQMVQQYNILLAGGTYTSDGNNKLWIGTSQLTIAPIDTTQTVVIDLGQKYFMNALESPSATRNTTLSLTLSNLKFINGYGPGSLIYSVSNIADSNITLNQCQLDSFSSPLTGGVFKSIAQSLRPRNRFIISQSNFTNISGVKAILITADSDVEITIDRSQITNSQASGGGMIETFYGALDISNSLFFNNSVGNHIFSVNTLDQDGSVTNCRFLNNSLSLNDNSGLFTLIDSTVTFDSCEFTNNTGGSILNIIREIKDYKTQTYINNNKFIRNTGALNGGVINLGELTTLYVNGTVFQENSATEKGGAIFAEEALLVSIKSSSFIDNQATTDGRSIYTDDTVVMNISKTEFKGLGNEIYCDGGGFSSLVLNNITYVNNLVDCAGEGCTIQGDYNNNNCSKKSGNKRIGEIIGIVIGVVFGLIIIGVVVYLIYKRNQSRKQYLPMS
ncbi:hypothetical protein PPL_11705 [Heterostelium album PN500]|uniref:Uncharacterized protein n=1 Tax=Heterostelium pallidum (strain ATCC 26659 / Pp 5 / PN500) TaxID=670386 RepID=D3BU86_HETP5|nr:hypothetical protein PPL_11705 [Heterostelium album PN500]EFA75020.1 hypothetical protein PPL_11705 [Heterostelium album PN500]|eukprot:XP_020427154.1 hypothetical protein PPL_11705 [Heterostelium album PN500]